MAADDTTFGTEMRGYRKDEVDSVLQELRRELNKANTERAESAKEVKRLLAVNEDLQCFGITFRVDLHHNESAIRGILIFIDRRPNFP